MDGKEYDTHTATIMGHICVRHGAPADCHLVWLYRKKNGEYFLVNSYYMEEPPRYEFEPVSEIDTRFFKEEADDEDEREAEAKKEREEEEEYRLTDGHYRDGRWV